MRDGQLVTHRANHVVNVWQTSTPLAAAWLTYWLVRLSSKQT